LKPDITTSSEGKKILPLFGVFFFFFFFFLVWSDHVSTSSPLLSSSLDFLTFFSGESWTEVERNLFEVGMQQFGENLDDVQNLVKFPNVFYGVRMKTKKRKEYVYFSNQDCKKKKKKKD
jgi:hypothetical protein